MDGWMDVMAMDVVVAYLTTPLKSPSIHHPLSGARLQEQLPKLLQLIQVNTKV